MMAELSVDDILAVDDRATEVISVPEWGGEVRVRAISARTRWAFEAAVMNGKERDYASLAEVSLDIVCEALGVGQRDRDKLARKSAAGLERVRDKALQLAGMKDKDIEEAAADFTPAPTDGSGTG